MPPTGPIPAAADSLSSSAPPIRRLDPHLVNQIAAGEVVERPASVVKELLENSLDAGATRIAVSVEAGGTQRVAVTDDGRGVPAEQLPLALASHATSKLASAAGLDAIATLGFRGEALASIASVSRLTLRSRVRDADGASIESDGGQVAGPRPVAASYGTSVEVRDLFFHTPARRRFLRSPQTEMAHVSETVQRTALTHPAVGFTLEHNGRRTLDLPPGQSRRARAVAILGEDLAEGLIEVDSAADPAPADGQPAPLPRVWALVGEPSLARATTRSQHLCVNGRPIRDRRLAHALKEGFRGLIPGDHHPLGVVLVEVEPRDVDVNVHPTKAEVRFRRPEAVYALVRRAVRQALGERDLVPSFAMPPPASAGEFALRDASGSPGPRFDWPTSDQPARPNPSAHAPLPAWDAGGGVRRDAEPEERPTRPGDDVQAEPPTGVWIGAEALVDYVRRMDPKRRGEVYREVRRAMAEDGEDGGDPEDAHAPAAEPRPGADDRDDASPGPAARLLQVHDSYVVTEDEHGLLIVDQHALHERVMFERLRRRVLGDGRPLEQQRLLLPATVSADAARLALLEQLGPLLTRLGVEAGPVGPEAAAVYAFPSLLLSRGVEAGDFLSSLLDKAESGEIDADALHRTIEADHDGNDSSDGDAGTPLSLDTEGEAALHEVLDLMACKAAVKAGDRLTEPELRALLAERDAVERASNCPHGRPTTLRLSLRDLERQFGRG